MKNYLVKATRNFFDKLETIGRNKDDEFYCTEDRYNELISHDNAVELIENSKKIEEFTTNEIKKNLKSSKKKSK